MNREYGGVGMNRIELIEPQSSGRLVVKDDVHSLSAELVITPFDPLRRWHRNHTWNPIAFQ
jgi:hypothetical protein